VRLSTKGRYGVRFMLDLAGKYGNGPVSLKDIAERQELSEKYLWHLIRLLKNAGLVHSTRGSQGGYVLAKPPEEITLKDILLVLEGPLDIVECVYGPRTCKRSLDCTARDVWTAVTDKILDTLESYSLAHMLKMQEQKSTSRISDYSI